MKRIIIVIISVLLSLSLFSQSYNHYFNQFEIRAHYGVSLPHHSYMNYLINSRVFIGEINYSIKTDGSKHWHNIWRCPELGVGYLAGGLGNYKVFGYSQSLFAFWGVPIIERERIIIKYRLGAGVAYLSEKFDSYVNYYNIAIGSHLNAHLYFALLFDIKPFNIPLYFSPGISFNHFSSGAMETPNLGINQLSVNFGIKYLYSPYPYSLMKRVVPYMQNPELEISAYYAASIKENTTYENKKYFINTLLVDVGARVSLKRSWGAGVCFIFDPSLKTLLEEQEKYTNSSNLFRIGIHAYHEVYFMENLSLVIQAGSYVYNKYSTGNVISWIYTKFGIRYTLNNGMFANIVLKTHAAAADYIEFGVGYRFAWYR